MNQETRNFMGSDDVPSLDPGIWKYLSADLIEKVLTKLPSCELLACRVLSKWWNCHIVSAGRTSAISFVSRTGLVRFVPDGEFIRESLTVFNDKRQRWDEVSLVFLGESGVHGPHSLIAADGGLLCFCDSSWESFVICNPLSKQWSKITPPTRIRPQVPEYLHLSSRRRRDNVLVGLVVSRSNYKLVVAGLYPCEGQEPLQTDDGMNPNGTTYVYDSFSRVWNKGPSIPSWPAFHRLRNSLPRRCNSLPQRSVVSNGNLYWSLIDEDGARMGGLRELVRFDVQNSEWGKVWMEEQLADLFVLRGKVHVMNLNDADERFPSAACCCEYKIRMIEDDGAQIRLKSKFLPQELVDLRYETQFVCGFADRYFCVGQGTSLFVMHHILPTEPDIFPERNFPMKGWRVLLFDSSKGTCEWLPNFYTDLYEDAPFSWWSFVPSLTAIP